MARLILCSIRALQLAMKSSTSARKGTNKHMQSIVATIQREQNEIIRHDEGRLLSCKELLVVVKRQLPCSGLYLLYKYREWLKADQIILFSPNSMFNSYVSNVLPELGEENMQQVTFQEYLNHRLSKSFDVEDPYEQLEYMLTETNSPTYKTRNASIRFKSIHSIFEMIRAYNNLLNLQVCYLEE